MCGIHAEFHSQKIEKEATLKRFNQIKHRGPDETVIYNNKNVFLGFHRLAIVGDTNVKTGQMLNKNGVFLTCNGEIYNYKFLISKFNLKPKSSSDCAVIIELYLLGLTPHEICNLLDGVFAFVLYDSNKNIVFAARDRIGVRPLFWGWRHNFVIFSSELKGFVNKEYSENRESTDKIYEYNPPNLEYAQPQQFLPGHFIFSDISKKYINDFNFYSLQLVKWSPDFIPHFSDYQTAKVIIRQLLTRAVEKRLMSERPVGYLLSGGLDSSLIASIGSKLTNGSITTFSIGFENSPDLLAARKVVEHLSKLENSLYFGKNKPVIHHEVIITEQDVLKALPYVVYFTETYDITTIRASIPMFLLAKYIREKTDIKVIMSGEGSDELYGGYLYFHDAPDTNAFQQETQRLITDLHMYDVLRSDRSTAAWGLEIRVPFLDTDHARFAVGLDPVYKMCGESSYYELYEPGIEKGILRDAFSIGEDGEDYLPKEILYRRKEAFSDGVGKGSVGALKKFCEEYFQGSELGLYTSFDSTLGLTPESKFYKLLFERYYGNVKPIEYYWMPKWNENVTDPSATVLKVYGS